ANERLTANHVEDLQAVDALPERTVDYLSDGVIKRTSTKPDYPRALGINGLRHLNSVSPLPSISIRGVREEDISPLRAAGAAGICFVSALCAAPDAEATARRFVAQWHGAS